MDKTDKPSDSERMKWSGQAEILKATLFSEYNTGNYIYFYFFIFAYSKSSFRRKYVLAHLEKERTIDDRDYPEN